MALPARPNVWTDRWKLIRYIHINKTQRFDLQTDPRETNDLADQPEHAAKVEEMMALLSNAHKQWGGSRGATFDT